MELVLWEVNAEDRWFINEPRKSHLTSWAASLLSHMTSFPHPAFPHYLQYTTFSIYFHGYLLVIIINVPKLKVSKRQTRVQCLNLSKAEHSSVVYDGTVLPDTAKTTQQLLVDDTPGAELLPLCKCCQGCQFFFFFFLKG